MLQTLQAIDGGVSSHANMKLMDKDNILKGLLGFPQYIPAGTGRVLESNTGAK